MDTVTAPQQAPSLGEPPRIRGNRFAGTAAIIIGLLHVVLIVYVFLTPAASRDDPAAFFRYFAQQPLALSAAWIVFGLSSVLALAVFPAIARFVRRPSSEWLRWATLYGTAGYVVQGVWALTLVRKAHDLAGRFSTGSEVTRAAILAHGLPEIDPDGWIMFGGPATFFIVSSVVALRSRRLPWQLSVAGVLLGLSLWSTVLGAALGAEPLHLVAAGGGALFFPIWFVGVGVILLRSGATHTTWRYSLRSP